MCAGGFFDPLGLASDNDGDKVFRLKTAEIKHGRLAMVAFLGEWCSSRQSAHSLLGGMHVAPALAMSHSPPCRVGHRGVG